MGEVMGKSAGEDDEPLATAESYVGDLHAAMTSPGDRECLVCYLLRMLGEFGCDGSHRWTVRWRDDQAPRATQLVQRLSRQGGCCDCEVAMNVYPERLPEDGAPPPECALVTRRGSTKPCHRDGFARAGWPGQGWWT